MVLDYFRRASRKQNINDTDSIPNDEKKTTHDCDSEPVENGLIDCSSPKTEENIDDKTTRLMVLIGDAIEKWAKEYNLERLPKKIVFEQALDAMRAMEKLL